MTGHPGRRPPLAVAVVVVAIAAMAIAARREGGLDGGLADGVWKHGRPVAALLAVVALAVVAARYARHRDDGYGVLHRAGTATAVLLTAAAVLTPIGLLFFGRSPSTRHAVAANVQGTMSRPRGMTMDPGKLGKAHHGVSIADIIVIVVLCTVVAAAVGMLLYSLITLLIRIRIRRRPVERIDFVPLDAEIEQLAEAVAAGSEALEYVGDAREAVIACYSAMEVAVTAGGGSRRATDTPEEFLRRVTAAHLIPDEPARRLTDLFREARFSRHPIAEEQRDAAREALRVISEHLRARVAEAEARVAAAAGRGSS